MEKNQKKFYKSWKFWTIILAVLLFLYAFGYNAAKNAPPSCISLLNLSIV